MVGEIEALSNVWDGHPVSTIFVPDVPQKWIRVSDNFGTVLVIGDESIFAGGDILQVPSIGVPFELPLLVVTTVVRVANN